MCTDCDPNDSFMPWDMFLEVSEELAIQEIEHLNNGEVVITLLKKDLIVPYESFCDNVKNLFPEGRVESNDGTIKVFTNLFVAQDGFMYPISSRKNHES